MKTGEITDSENNLVWRWSTSAHQNWRHHSCCRAGAPPARLVDDGPPAANSCLVTLGTSDHLFRNNLCSRSQSRIGKREGNWCAKKTAAAKLGNWRLLAAILMP